VREQIGWLLEDFRSRVAGLTHAVALSADGLVLAATAGLTKSRAAQLGAITSGLAGISHGAAELFRSGRVLQIAVEMDIGYLLVTRIDDRACVATLAVREADLEQVGYEVTVLVDRVGKVLAPLPRSGGPGNGTTGTTVTTGPAEPAGPAEATGPNGRPGPAENAAEAGG
jgi:predicted regulator of Ras-like GTPase activity (Roadblock/LC7/MglB family)